MISTQMKRGKAGGRSGSASKAWSREGVACSPQPHSPGPRTAGRCWRAADASQPGSDSAASLPARQHACSRTRRHASVRAAGSRSPGDRRRRFWLGARALLTQVSLLQASPEGTVSTFTLGPSGLGTITMSLVPCTAECRGGRREDDLWKQEREDE